MFLIKCGSSRVKVPTNWLLGDVKKGHYAEVIELIKCNRFEYQQGIFTVFFRAHMNPVGTVLGCISEEMNGQKVVKDEYRGVVLDGCHLVKVSLDVPVKEKLDL